MKPRGRLLVGVLVGVGIALALFALLALLDGEAETGTGAPVGDAAHADSVLNALGPRPQVEVLNAAGIPGLAARATDHLRDRGVDVVYIGNADEFGSRTTVVVARTAEDMAARRVARALGVDSVTVEPDPSRLVDATVRLGRDWVGATAVDTTRSLAERVRGLLP